MPSSRSRTADSLHSRVSSAFAVLSLATELVLAMRRAVRPSAEKAIWNDCEVNLLLDYLAQHQSEGEGGSFKKSTFNNCAEYLKSTDARTAGPVKTGTMCATKWSSLKSTYQSISTYRSTSGFSWDPTHGANIMDDASTKVWDVYVSRKENSGIKPYRNKGWALYDKVQQVVPSQARGSRAFHPSQAPPVSASPRTSVPPALTAATATASPTSTSAATCDLPAPSPIQPPPATTTMCDPVITDGSSLPSPPQSSAASYVSSVSSTSKRKRSNTGSVAPSKRAASSQLSLSSHSSTSSKARPNSSSTGGAIDLLQGEMKKLSTVLSSVRFPPPPPTSEEIELNKQALASLSSPDLDLSVDEQVALAMRFTKQPEVMRTYILMPNDLVRKAFAKTILDESIDL